MASDELILIKDCDYVIPVTIDANGTVVDLTDATVKFQVTKSANDPADRALFTIEQTSHTNPTEGETTIEIPKEQINQFGNFVYRLWYITAAGKVSKTFFGKLKIEY